MIKCNHKKLIGGGRKGKDYNNYRCYFIQMHDAYVKKISIMENLNIKENIRLNLYSNKIKHCNIAEAYYLDISDNPIRYLKTKLYIMYIADTKIKSIKIHAYIDRQYNDAPCKHYIKDLSYLYARPYDIKTYNNYLDYIINKI